MGIGRSRKEETSHDAGTEGETAGCGDWQRRGQENGRWWHVQCSRCQKGNDENQGRAVEEGRSGEKGQRGGGKEEKIGRSRKEETSHDAGTEGETAGCGDWQR